MWKTAWFRREVCHSSKRSLRPGTRCIAFVSPAASTMLRCVLFLVLGVASAVAAAQHRTFADYLASQSTSGFSVASNAGYYEATEIREACLNEIAYRNCSMTPYGYYFE